MIQYDDKMRFSIGSIYVSSQPLHYDQLDISSSWYILIITNWSGCEED